MPEIPLWSEFVGLLTQGLVYLYRSVGNFGLAIIVFTVVTRLLLLPLTIQQLRSSRQMQRMQPHLADLQRRHGRDRAALAQEQMRLYREHGVNPAAGCLPMVLQMPIWFGLYQALFALSANPEFAGPFLWIPDLARTGAWTDWWAWPLAIFTGLSQWVLQKMMSPQSSDPQQQMVAGVMNVMPIMFAFFAFSVPHGLVLYWGTSNIVSLVQQYFFTGWGSLKIPALGITGPTAQALPPPPGRPARPERPAPRQVSPPAPPAPREETRSASGIRTYTLEPDREDRGESSAEAGPSERQSRPPRRKRKRS